MRRFEAEFLDYLQSGHKGVFDAIRETRDLSDDTVTSLKDAITEFKKGFTTSDGELLIHDEPVAALGADEVGQEKIRKVVRPAEKK
ncbi:hypothetical protein FHR33_003760 [Nonomuraea dietziae]|uniref:ATP synthase alpha chain n=1 Tax=Nonomuraea dietziae TaxID=65515 RepID=A0A7W5VAF8_9ACTN|nr:hypothetical protein [Nonomuraea dietziae]